MRLRFGGGGGSYFREGLLFGGAYYQNFTVYVYKRKKQESNKFGQDGVVLKITIKHLMACDAMIIMIMRTTEKTNTFGEVNC